MKKIIYSLSILAIIGLFVYGCEPSDSCYYDVDRSVYIQGTRASARMFYPCNIDQLNDIGATTLTSGMGGTKEGMYWLAEPIAAAGMVAVAVSATDNQTVGGYETAHKTGFGILQEENGNPDSPLYEKIGKYGIMGYSKGGGGSINAASDLGDQVDTCIGLAPWGANPTSNLSAATMILTGTIDAIAPAYMGYNAFTSLPDVPRLYASLIGEGHFFWNSNSNPGNADDLIVSWLKYYLEGDDSFISIIEDPGSQFTDYEYYPEDGSTDPGGCE